MRSFRFAAIALSSFTLISASAVAQQTAQQAPVVLSPSLARSIYVYLVQGGPYASAARLAEDLQDAADAPARDRSLREQIERDLKARAERDAKEHAAHDANAQKHEETSNPAVPDGKTSAPGDSSTK